MWRLIICPGLVLMEWHFFLRWFKQLFAFGAYKRWICWHPLVPLNANIITPWKLHYLWGPWVECLQPSLEVSSKYVLPPPALVSLVCPSFWQNMSKVNSDFWTLGAPCRMEAPWLPTVLNILTDIHQCCPIIKDLIIDVLVGHVCKGLPYLHLNPLAVQRCVIVQTGVLFLSLSGSGGAI